MDKVQEGVSTPYGILQRDGKEEALPSLLLGNECTVGNRTQRLNMHG